MHLDDTTTPEVVIDIWDSSGASIGRLFFHLDAHGYQLDSPTGEYNMCRSHQCAAQDLRSNRPAAMLKAPEGIPTNMSAFHCF